MKDVLELTQELVRLPSVTPSSAGTIERISTFLQELGFETTVLSWGETTNLYASLGTGSPSVLFLGHTDVVPVGNPSLWVHPPFGAVVKDGILWGRGVADMKGAVAAFMCAIQTYLSQQKKGERLKGRLTLLLTTDEEGDGHDGIRRVVPWLEARNALPDFCLVGEPTSVHQTGDTIKIGRRGSLLSELVCYGKSGHIAYPHLADNPIPRLTKTLYCLKEHPLDRGDDMFQPSNLEVTSLYTKNAASNVIPGMVSARFGIRFNPHQTIEGLEDWIRGVSKAHAGQHQLSFHRSGEPYLTTDSAWIKRVEGAVQSVTGDMPERSTSGGTSDGRFLGARCPVVELGLTNKTIHQIDECVLVKDLYLLQRMYEQFLAMTFV